MDLIINTDGASRGNPGPSSYGFLIKTATGVILHQEGKVIGNATNNIAEYRAVLASFEYIKKYLPQKIPCLIEVVTDSQLITNQLNGKYKVRNPILKKLHEYIKLLEVDLGRVHYRNVPRKENFLADRLANKALDQG